MNGRRSHLRRLRLWTIAVVVMLLPLLAAAQSPQPQTPEASAPSIQQVLPPPAPKCDTCYAGFRHFDPFTDTTFTLLRRLFRTLTDLRLKYSAFQPPKKTSCAGTARTISSCFTLHSAFMLHR